MFDFKNFDLKKEIEEIVKNDPGQERGADIKFLRDYAVKKKGQAGADRVAAELKKCGYEIPDIDKFKELEWIPSSLPTVYMLAMVKVFEWVETEIKQMGKDLFTMSPTLKIFIKYFVSLKMTLETAVRTWPKYYTFGQLSVIYNGKDKHQIILRLLNFKKHPVTCVYLSGTFSKLVELATGKIINIEETKCMFNGDPYHEYLFKWQ